MKEIPLREALIKHTQSEIAKKLGVTQSGISQMLRAGREVIVVLSSDGSVSTAYEKRRIGRQLVVMTD